jgi:hypothetical protein
MASHHDWLMVCTCARLNAEGAPASHSEAVASCVVTLYHARTHRSVQYKGTCGTFLPNPNAAGDTSSDPLVAVFVSTSTNRGEFVYCVDLGKSGAAEHSLPLEPTDLSAVVAGAGEEVCWSAALPVMQLHLGALPSSAVPGSMAGFFLEDGEERVVVLSSVGALFTLSGKSGEVLKSSSASEEFIVSSDLVLTSTKKPVIYALTGTNGNIVRIPPSAIMMT